MKALDEFYLTWFENSIIEIVKAASTHLMLNHLKLHSSIVKIGCLNTKKVFSGFLGIDFKGNDNNNALFTVAVLQIILSIIPALIACVRSCLCREKSHLGET